MIRVKISNFIKKYKAKIKDLLKKLIMVAIVVFIATIILSSIKEIEITDEEEKGNVYKPTETVITGSNVSKEQYEKDSNLVNIFLKHCNNGDIQSAYNLLSDECKEEKYPTIETFKKNYINTIFSKERQCNLQSWISLSGYTVYRVRYTNNMLATGTYEENDVYQDYITLKKKNDEEKISIGNFIDSKKLNIVTKTKELEATVVKKMQYVSYEEYEIEIKNISDKIILLNNLTNDQTILLIGGMGIEYPSNINGLFINDLIIPKNLTTTITLRFMKDFSSSNKSVEIEMKNIIKDYKKYKENQKDYNDVTTITIEVED